MITQFENGFITKSKLNEMVDGINTNSEDVADIDSRVVLLELNTPKKSDILTANETKTFGSGGDFATLAEALTHYSSYISNGYTINLNAVVGYNFNESIALNYVDLGFVIIGSSDGLSRKQTGGTGDLFKGNHSIMPQLNVTIIGNNSRGFLNLSFSRIVLGTLKQFKNFISTYITNGSYIFGTGVDMTSTTEVFGLLEIQSGVADLFNLKANNVYATGASRVCIASGVITNDIRVFEGSTISANGSTGTLSQTANTITADGIIFK